MKIITNIFKPIKVNVTGKLLNTKQLEIIYNKKYTLEDVKNEKLQ